MRYLPAKYMTYLPTQEEIRQLLCDDLPDNFYGGNL